MINNKEGRNKSTVEFCMGDSMALGLRFYELAIKECYNFFILFLFLEY